MKKACTIIMMVIGMTGLTACQSPTATMHPQQVSQLSNEQLCNLKNAYPWEQNLELELGRRGLNCDPDFNECRNRGIDPQSPAMGSCINDVREKRRMQLQMQMQKQQIDRQKRQRENDLITENLRLRRQQSAAQPQSNSQFCNGFPFCK